MNETDHRDLIARLDLPAKVRLLTGGDVFTLADEPRIGLEQVAFSDGPTGVRGLKFTGGRTVANFPNATVLAAAWDVDAAEEVGRLLAEEAMAQQIHVVLGPTINLHRSTLGGRLFEQYSEDPLLSGKLAAAYVRGLQSHDVGACLKHLVGNESETARNTVNSVIDETTLRELYLLPFEIATDEARPWSMMAAYNDVNGVAATEQDHVINEIVKGEWGFDGLVMSDWFGTKTAAPAANGGLDLVMPGPVGPWGDALVADVQNGLVDESVIDDHLERLLRLADRVGALLSERRSEERAEPRASHVHSSSRSWPTDIPAPDSPTRREQLTRLAAAGLTVLTNSGDALPLQRGTTVALIGRPAIDTIGMGGGSAHVNPPYQVSVADGLTALLGDDVTVTDGVEVRVRPVPAVAGFVVDPRDGTPGVRALVWDGAGNQLDDKHLATAFSVFGMDDGYPAPVGRVQLHARVEQGGPTEVGVIGLGAWTLRIEGRDWRREFVNRPAGTGLAEDMLVPPTSSTEVDLTPGDVLVAELVLPADRPTGSFDTGGLIARPVIRDQDAVIAEAVAAAGPAEIAVVVVGLTEELETEAVDKSTLALPGRQDDLVRAVAAAARRTVVVVNAATPVLMPWLDDVDAVLWAGLPGQEAGHAIAAVLVGDQEPTGRLVTTFPAADGAAPAWGVTPDANGDLHYTEGTFVGYRGHDAGRAPAPAFWFGHGLGYGRWEYPSAELVTGGGDRPDVRVTVRNTGPRTSREVVQVYFRPAQADQPVRLVGWATATVEPGATATVTVTPEARMWRRWDDDAQRWADLGTGGELIVARGLGDVRATLPLS